MYIFFLGTSTFLVGLLVGLGVWLWARLRHEGVVSDLKDQVTRVEAARQAEVEKTQWASNTQQGMRDVFQALAGEALKSNSQALTAETKKDISGVVAPLQEKLKTLDEHVRALEKARTGAYRGIETHLETLMKAHGELRDSTISLKSALQSSTVRGRWGEIQLRRCVEMAGMESNVAFTEQLTTEGGRPDLVVNLPNAGALPIDSKVPLNAYLSAMESSDPDVRKQQLVRHAKAVRSRINELGQKKYWDQFEKAPEFVVMFVPNEACLAAAFDVDPGLLEDAIDKKVLICSPVTLVALLRAVAYGWQQRKLTENAQQSAGLGKELFDRTRVFVGHLGRLGVNLNKTTEAFNKSIASLERRVMPTVRKLKELGDFEGETDVPEPVELLSTLPKQVGSGTEVEP